MTTQVKQSDKFGTPPSQAQQRYADNSTASKEDEVEYYRLRVKDLEIAMDSLQSECAGAHRKNKSLSLSESKVEQFIKENSTLHMDKEKSDRLLKQKKTEAELWKQKYDNFLGQYIQSKANYELELQQLNQHNQTLQSQLQSAQYDSQNQCLEIKAAYNEQNYDQLEAHKKHFKKQQDASEQQMEKIRSHNEEVVQNYDDLIAKLMGAKEAADKEVQTLQQQNLVLVGRISDVEREKQTELTTQSHSLSSYSESQLDNLKKSYNNEHDILVADVDKLRGLMELKNVEIETLRQQNHKMRSFNAEQSAQLREELTLIKEALLEQERESRTKLEHQLAELSGVQNEETQMMTQNFNNQIENLEAENQHQKMMLDARSEEFASQITEKMLIKELLEKEIAALNQVHEDQTSQFSQFRLQKNTEIDEIQDLFTRSNAQSQQQHEQNVLQQDFLVCEVERMKEQIKQGSLDAESHAQQGRLQRRELEDQAKQLTKQCQDLRTENAELEALRVEAVEDMKAHVKRQDGAHRERIRVMESEVDGVKLECRRMKDQLTHKSEEIEVLIAQKCAMEREVRKIRDEIEDFKAKLVQAERQKDMEDQQSKQARSQEFEVRQLKDSFNTQLQVLAEENEDLQGEVHRQRGQIKELCEKFESESQANKSCLDAYSKSHKIL